MKTNGSIQPAYIVALEDIINDIIEPSAADVDRSGTYPLRSPVAVKIALAIVGRIGGNAGSPNPVGGWLDFMKS